MKPAKHIIVDITPGPEPLTTQEEKDLARLEGFVEKGSQVLMEHRIPLVNSFAALQEIKARKLYRVVGTWEIYCWTKWRKSVDTIDRCIKAYEKSPVSETPELRLLKDRHLATRAEKPKRPKRLTAGKSTKAKTKPLAKVPLKPVPKPQRDYSDVYTSGKTYVPALPEPEEPDTPGPTTEDVLSAVIAKWGKAHVGMILKAEDVAALEAKVLQAYRGEL